MSYRYKAEAHPVVKQLRQIRLSKRIRQGILADDIGYHRETLGDWERGKRLPRLASLIDWCDALNVRLTVVE